jgi:hypothetical protein
MFATPVTNINMRSKSSHLSLCRLWHSPYRVGAGQVQALRTRISLLAFSFERRHFCPSVHQKRVVQFGEQLREEVLKLVPHRHFIFSLPKIRRRYSRQDRKLLSKPGHCSWDSLKVVLLSPSPRYGPQAPLSLGFQAQSTARSAKAQPTYTKHWIGYSESQDAPSDNALFSLTLI